MNYYQSLIKLDAFLENIEESIELEDLQRQLKENSLFYPKFSDDTTFILSLGLWKTKNFYIYKDEPLHNILKLYRKFNTFFDYNKMSIYFYISCLTNSIETVEYTYNACKNLNVKPPYPPVLLCKSMKVLEFLIEKYGMENVMETSDLIKCSDLIMYHGVYSLEIVKFLEDKIKSLAFYHYFIMDNIRNLDILNYCYNKIEDIFNRSKKEILLSVLLRYVIYHSKEENFRCYNILDQYFTQKEFNICPETIMAFYMVLNQQYKKDMNDIIKYLEENYKIKFTIIMEEFENRKEKICFLRKWESE